MTSPADVIRIAEDLARETFEGRDPPDAVVKIVLARMVIQLSQGLSHGAIRLAPRTPLSARKRR